MNKVNRNEMVYDKSGSLLLSPGDYIIPVMTYCMKSSGKSPDGHIYSLSKLQGKRVAMIRKLNLQASPKISFEDIQIVSWSMQAGLSYNEMTEKSQKIIDKVIPEFKPQLKESFLSVIENKWNQVSSRSRGILPTFEEGIEDAINELGEVGEKISQIRHFKSRLDEVGHDYSSLSELIEVTSSKNKKIETLWSKISENVYARFVTDKHYQEIGLVQIRVLSNGQARAISSNSDQKTSIDLVLLMADPQDKFIQPLSFSPLFGFAGIIATPVLTNNPLAAAALLAAVLASQSMDWDTFFELQNLLENSESDQVSEKLEKGMKALMKEHDELEKPLKDAGIISGKSKNTSKKEKKKVREYTKSGGEEQLQKDFDKLPGIPSKAKDGKDGKDTKTLQDGTTIVKRPKDKQDATLEVQAPQNESKFPEGLKVKVRYP